MTYDVPMVDFGEFGSRLRKLRTRKQLSQSKVAEQAHLVPSYYNMIENGKKMPSLDVLLRIANILDTTLDEMFLGEYTSSKDPYSHLILSLIEQCSARENKVVYEVVAALVQALEDSHEG